MVLISLVVMVSSCGYRFAGGGMLPSGLAGVDVGVIDNRTSDTGVETFFRSDLVEQCTRRGFYKSGQGADTGLIRGEIRNFITGSLVHVSGTSTYERRVTVVMDLRLLGPDGEVVKSIDGIRESKEYKVIDASKAETEMNRKNAIVEISREIAFKIVDRLTEDF